MPVHLEREQREDGAEGIAREAVGRHGGGPVQRAVYVDQVGGGGDEDAQVAPREGDPG